MYILVNFKWNVKVLMVDNDDWLTLYLYRCDYVDNPVCYWKMTITENERLCWIICNSTCNIVRINEYIQVHVEPNWWYYAITVN